MSKKSEKIGILELYWDNTLNQYQKNAWYLCARMCPSTVAQKDSADETGKAFFVACNMKRMV